MQPITVINSKAATKDLENIKSRYGDIVQGMNEQSVRVQQYQDQQKIENKEKEVADAMNAKEATANDMKTKELEIKRAALTA